MILKRKEEKKVELIHLKEIDSDDYLFRMTFSPDLNLLKCSMDKIGLINPLVLWEKEGRVLIVCGYRRVLVAKDLRWELIPAKIYRQEELNICEGFILNFYENLGTRRFNLIEAEMVISGFIERCRFNEKQIQEQILPLLGFSPGRKVFLALKALRNLTEDWKEFIIKNELSLFNAAKIADFSCLEQRSLYSWLSRLRLGENKMRESLEMVEEICKRDRISVEELFSYPAFKSLFQQGELNINEKTEQFRKLLKAIRYPELTRLQEKFQEYKKQLSLPPAISFLPPEYFEGDKLRVSFDCRSVEEFQLMVKKLDKISRQVELRNMFALL